MGGYATMQTRLWSETATWPADAKLLFIWTWTNDHVHGVTGIGKVPDVVIAAETGLDGARLKRAKRFIAQVKKVLWFEDNWYWVVGRMRHTVFANAEHANPSLFIAATKYFAEHRVPQALAKELGATYPQLGTTLASGCIHTPPHPADVPNPNPNPKPKPGTDPEKDKNPSPCPTGQSDDAGGVVPYRAIIDAWNTAARGTPLPQVKTLTDRRRTHIHARWQEELFRENYARLFEKAVTLPLLRGERPSIKHPNWRGDFDWLTANDGNYVKVLEGKYDEQSQKNKGKFLQVGNEYDNIAKVVDTNGDEGTGNENG